MNQSTVDILTKLFLDHRLVFWYDTEGALLHEFEELELPNVEKLVIDHNEFGLKIKILHDHPEQKYLLYQNGPRPTDEENWLLDLLLSNVEFCTDEASLILADLGLDRQVFHSFIQKTAPFFRQSVKRVDALKAALVPGASERESQLALKMMALCVDLEPEERIDHILMELLKEFDQVEHEDCSDEKWQTIRSCGLEESFWNQMRRSYGYSADSPGLFDFILTLFRDAYRAEFEGNSEKWSLSSTAQSFLRDWRDHQKYAVAFNHLSCKCADQLEISRLIADKTLKDFESFDIFSIVDKQLLQLLAREIAANTYNRADIKRIIDARRNTHWYPRYADTYDALDAASSFLSAIPIVKFDADSAADAVRKYAKSWYKLDRDYRSFVFHARNAAKATDCLEELQNLINGKYANQVLPAMNNEFQKKLDTLESWDFGPELEMQREFFRRHPGNSELGKKKVFVIISDAFRYEIATELLERIQETNRYTVKLTPLIAALPSYTKLGMAALLPHQQPDDAKSLAFADKLPDVLVDGMATAGLEDRRAILAKAMGEAGATTVRAEDLLSFNRKQIMDLQRDHRVVYVYHNDIDAIGDAFKTEGQVFEAVERSVEILLAIIKKVGGYNHVMHYFITSDHGFLYQERPVAESDFLACPDSDAAAMFKNRRFLIGKDLPESPALMSMTEKELGLAGQLQVQIPRSVNRMKLSGSGSRYTHGGASLQEVVIPLLHVQRRDADDISQVDIDLLHEGQNLITTAQLAVRLYQSKPVGGKVLPRTLRIGIFSKDGNTLLSNQAILTFASESKLADDRLNTVNLVLNHQADTIKNDMVQLVIESRIGETAQYKPYKKEEYRLRRTFTNDF